VITATDGGSLRIETYIERRLKMRICFNCEACGLCDKAAAKAETKKELQEIVERIKELQENCFPKEKTK